MEKEINNTNVVSMIESKLPKNLALNWYRFIHSSHSTVDKFNKFPDLLKFIITERNALEYGMADLRISEKRFGIINYVKTDNEIKCLIHNDNSHVNERYGLLKDKSACFSCLSPNHMTY